jgi:hypothetical protein
MSLLRIPRPHPWVHAAFVRPHSFKCERAWEYSSFSSHSFPQLKIRLYNSYLRILFICFHFGALFPSHFLGQIFLWHFWMQSLQKTESHFEHSYGSKTMYWQIKQTKLWALSLCLSFGSSRWSKSKLVFALEDSNFTGV